MIQPLPLQRPLEAPVANERPNRATRRQSIKLLLRHQRTPFLQELRAARAIEARFNPPTMAIPRGGR